MKTRNTTKIFATICALVLLVGAFFAICASADDAPTLKIVAKNVDFQDVYTVVFAVESSDESADIELLYYLENPAVNGEATGYKAVKGSTDSYANVFYTHGVSAQNITEEIWAQAHIVGTDTYSDVVKYSVAEYIFARLYKHNVVSATEGAALNEKAFLESFVEFASNAQAHLEKEEAGTLAKNYYYAYAQDGTLNGGDNSEMFDPASASVTLAYTGTSANVVGWTKTTYENGVATTEDVELNATVSLTGHTVFAPRFLAPLTEGETFDNLTTLAGSGSDSKVLYGTSTLASTGTPTSGDTIELAADPTGAANKVLKFVDGITAGASTVGVGVTTDCQSSESQYATAVFETKLYIAPNTDTSTSVPFAEIYFTAGRTQKSTKIRLYTQSSNSYAVFSVSGASLDTTGKETENKITTNAWHIIRLEFDQHISTSGETSVIRIYIDGLYAGSYDSTISVDSININRFMWNSYSTNTSTVYFDNMSLTEKVTAYPAE